MEENFEHRKFNELLNKNPNKGTPCDIIIVHEPNTNSLRDKVVVPKWITGFNEDSLINIRSLNKFLGKLGYSSQLFYDVVKLGLADISQRPVCDFCNKSVKYRDIRSGYRLYCSNSCHISAENRDRAAEVEEYHRLGGVGLPPKIKEFRDKISKGNLGKKTTQDTINKRISTINRKKEAGWKRKKQSPESHKKQADAIRGRKRSKESIEKGRQTYYKNKEYAKANNIPFNIKPESCSRKGKKLSPESRMRIKMSNMTKDKSYLKSDRYREMRRQQGINYFKNNPDKLPEFVFNGKAYSNKGKIHLEKYNKPKDFYYMSSWEKKFLEEFDSDDSVKEIFSPNPIQYTNPLDGKIHSYLPDIGLILDDNSVIIIEVKPLVYMDDIIVSAKRKKCIEYCKRYGYSYVTLTENELNMRNMTIDYIINIVKYKYYNY